MSHSLVILAPIVSQTLPEVNTPGTPKLVAQCISFPQVLSVNQWDPSEWHNLSETQYKKPVENCVYIVENLWKTVLISVESQC